jgi:hypothetical protein
MIKIAHRGNVSGPNPGRENTSKYIDEAIALGYIAEVDIWKVGDRLYMTHDCKLNDRTEINIEWLRSRINELIIHCKDIVALQYFAGQLDDWHYFWHQEDNYTLTSAQWIWAYPGQPMHKHSPKNIYDSVECTSICVMPELSNQDTSNFAGVCSDYIENY